MTENEPVVEKAEPPKIKNIERELCGCVTTETEDGNKMFAPCPPHGLFRVAQHLQDAASAMGATATTLMNEGVKAQQSASMVEAIKKAQADTAAQDARDADADKPGNIVPGPGAE